MKFDVFPIAFKRGWHNVIHFSAFGNDLSKYGDRIPGVWFHANNVNQLYLCSAVSGNKDHCKVGADTAVQKGVWSTVTIKQRKDGQGRYVYTININGKVAHSVINTDARLFKNVKVYVGDPWYAHQAGYIRKLSVDIGKNTFLSVNHISLLLATMSVIY